MELAPIVLFAYNRPWHIKQTLESLFENSLAKDSDLFIYCDGPKDNSPIYVLKNINNVRKVIREKLWCKTVTIIESDKNKGLSNSIIEGVTFLVNKHSKIIVIEDDVLLSPFFLKFMNESLEQYKDNNNILSIGSWNYFCNPQLLDGNFFFRFPDSIAWGTFKRAWDFLEKDSSKALKIIVEKDLEKKFNGNLPFPYFTNMLQEQIDGKINSWAIRWTATAVIHNMVSFFPKQALSKHIGFGNEATHETGEKDYNSHLVLSPIEIPIIPINVRENETAIKEWRKSICLLLIPKTTFKKESKKIFKKIVPDVIIKLVQKKFKI